MDYHVPIMLEEITDALDIKEGGLYFDGTLGGGGHSLEILKRGGRLLATDLDGDAIAYASTLFDKNGYSGKYTLVRDNFKNASDILEEYGINRIDGAVLDLGISSHQVDEPVRGFSYRFDAKLDMRMDDRQELTAYDVVNKFPEEKLIKILYEYGEERFAKRIVGNIIKQRKFSPIETTAQLAGLIEQSTPHIKGGHPAKKTFQAIRIEVNRELEDLGRTLEKIIEKLKPGGRLCVITFHSLEDRIVKQTFKRMATDCLCEPNMPICVCGHKADISLIKIKQKASAEEQDKNARSKSATLRIAEKL